MNEPPRHTIHVLIRTNIEQPKGDNVYKFLALIITITVSVVSAWSQNAAIKVFNGNDVQVCALLPLPDAGYIVVGHTTYQNGDFKQATPGPGYYDVFVARFEKAGAMRWLKMFGQYQDDIGTSALVTSDGSIIIGGITNVNVHYKPIYSSDVFVVKLNAQGAIMWNRVISGGDSVKDTLVALAQSSDGGVLLTGRTWGARGDFAVGDNQDNSWDQLFVIKLDSQGRIFNTVHVDEPNSTLLSIGVAPNPGSTSFTISYTVHSPGKTTLEIVNSAGEVKQMMTNGNVEAGTYELQVSLDGYSSGTYMVRLTNNQQTIAAPLSVVK